MTAGPFLLYDTTLAALMAGTLNPLADTDITAVLLSPAYVPDLAAHTTYADISAAEIIGSDYRQLRLTGGMVAPLSGAAAAFTSDPLNWGNPVTLPPTRYMTLLLGLPSALTPASPLIGVQQLTTGAVEAVRGAFTVSPPAGGWFHLARG
ncbi:hypothetical protein [Kordiimonas marina]|uniref:hypothetical protein n=1 Tax=Kordiimonas marina TaxID=2872312 RepID=UPI001FF28A3F|nr:hypothetical protein [Kordiimonas marina]MCJ9428687.1 hypothetical protein [Kordiimonas marina]